MKTMLNSSCAPAIAVAGLALAQRRRTCQAAAGAAGYLQTNLVTDNTNAAHVDPRLLNPWGIVASPAALWVNDNHSGLMTAYSEQGRPSSAAVNIPAPGGGSGAPTGL